jgi:hypothetical protein
MVRSTGCTEKDAERMNYPCSLCRHGGLGCAVYVFRCQICRVERPGTKLQPGNKPSQFILEPSLC